ncbi:hypothetical protein SUGI_0656990 [Cryptomeria japonica]|nr:hypothetical protein SUGI_0656990 [Cryptomeria japonica]
MKDGALHVLMFPWLAQGHISPFLELSKRLANQGLRISFLSTPNNISKINSSLHEKWVGKIDMVELPLPSVEGLPPEADNTADIPIEMADLLKIALDGLQNPFEHLLRRIQPDYIIHDFSQHWAAKFGIPAVYFCIFSASAIAYAAVPSKNKAGETTIEDLTAPPPDYPSSVIAYKPYEASSVLAGYNGHDDGGMTILGQFFESMEACKLMLVRSCFEFSVQNVLDIVLDINKMTLPFPVCVSY